MKETISVRCTDRMNEILDELSEKKLLNTSSIVKLALATLYEKEIKGGEQNGNR